jgi:Carboxypeptidase regulatory-like domain
MRNQLKGTGLVRGLLLWLAAVCICAAPTLAQTSVTGALTGTVTDPSGAVIVGATVTATNHGTGQERTTTTDANGAYKFSLLSPGDYDVKFSARGFETAEVPSITVNVTETPVLNRALQIGSQAQHITVQSNAQIIQTQNATVGQLVGSHEVIALPLSSRNYTQILNLAPGVVNNVNQASGYGTGSQDVQVNGSGAQENNYEMDGVVVNDAFSNEGAGVRTYGSIAIPNPDSIEEFNVQTAQYDASFGRNPGANVNVVTKGGTNQFHGDAWEFNRNNFFNANDFFLKHQELSPGGSGVNAPQILKQNQFGFTFGGPIKKNKVFFFASYQGTRQINGIVSEGYETGVSIPAINDYADVASGICANLRCTNNTAAYQAYLGRTFGVGGPEPQGTISGTGPAIAADGSNISPVAIAILQAPGLKGGLNQGFFVPGASASCAAPCLQSIEDPATANENQFMINTDYVLSSKNTFSERYFHSSQPTGSPFGGSLPGSPYSYNFENDVANLRLTSTLTSNLVNDARISLNRMTTVGEDDWNLDACSVGMIPPINNGAPCPAVAGANADLYKLPSISISGLKYPGYFSAGAFSFAGSTYNTDMFEASNEFEGGDQISWNRGKQSIRAGFEYDWTQLNYGTFAIGRSGINFGTLGDFLYGGPGTIIGTGGGSRSTPQGEIQYNHFADSNAYIQDDIKATSHLTVNIGVRWEYDGVATETGGFAGMTNAWANLLSTVNTGSYFLNNPQGTLAGYVVPSNYPSELYGFASPTGATGVFVNTNKTKVPHGAPWDVFSPRFGLAWQPIGSRFVIRGGYGWFHDSVFVSDQTTAMEGNPPEVASYPANQLPFQTLADPFPKSFQGTSCVATGGVCPVLGWVPRTLAAPTHIGTITPYYRIPLVQEYNLDVQYQLPRNWIASLGYVGSHGTHLYDSVRQFNPDYILAGAPNTPAGLFGEVPASALPFNDPLNPVANWVTTNNGPGPSAVSANQNERVPYLGLGAGSGLSVTGMDGDDLYDSLQAVISHQFSHGILFQGAYTWSKLMTTLNGPTEVGGQAEGSLIAPLANSGYTLNSAQEYGLASWNRSQRLVLSYSYDLPWRSQGWTEKVLGGWTLSGVTTLQNGQPLTITDPAGGSIYGYATTGGTSRAELAHPVNCNVATGNCQSAVPFSTPGGVEARLNCYFAIVSAHCPGITAASAAIAPSGSEPMIGGEPNPNPGPYTGTCTKAATGTTEFVDCGTIYGNAGVGVITGPGQWNWDMSLAKTLPITEGTRLEFRAEAFNLWNHTQFDNPVSLSTSSSLLGEITSAAVPPRIMQFALKFYF